MTRGIRAQLPQVVVLVLDGLRSDWLTESTAPFLRSRQGGGLCFQGFRSVFPSSTRICAATIATGAYPASHGIVENELLVSEGRRSAIASCADASNLVRLPRCSTGTILGTDTLGQILARADMRFFTACSGSAGTTYLANPAAIGDCVNWQTAWPTETRNRIGSTAGFLGEDSTTDARNAFIIDRALEAFTSDFPPDVCVLWFTEPDEAQHSHGIGSPQASDHMRALDQRLKGLYEGLLRLRRERKLVFLALSDHGCVTPQGLVDPISELVASGLKVSRESHDVIHTSNSFFVSNGKLIPPLTEFLAEAEWIDRIFLRDDVWLDHLPAEPLSVVNCNHPRAAEIMVSYSATDAPSLDGIPGSCALVGNKARHGSLSKYEMEIPLFAWRDEMLGKGVEQVSADLTDIAPAILSLLEVPGQGSSRLPLAQRL